MEATDGFDEEAMISVRGPIFLSRAYYHIPGFLIIQMVFFWSCVFSFLTISATTWTSLDKLVLSVFHTFILSFFCCALFSLFFLSIVYFVLRLLHHQFDTRYSLKCLLPLLVTVVLLVMTIVFPFPIRDNLATVLAVFILLFLVSWPRPGGISFPVLMIFVLSAFLVILILNPFRVVSTPGQTAMVEGPGLVRSFGPDIILISIDTLRADHLGCYGHPTIKTPQVDRLARSSRLYTDAVSPQALTGPAHATMLTGRFPDELGCFSNGDRIDQAQPNIATVFRSAGYRAYAVVSGYPLKHEFFNLSDSFDVYDDVFSPWWFPHDSIFTFPLARILADRGLVYDRRYLFERRGRQVNERVFALTQRQTEPLFLFVHYYEPHGPYEPQPPYNRLYFTGDVIRRDEAWPLGTTFPAYQRLRGIDNLDYPRSQYMGEISHTDMLIGQLLSRFLQQRHDRDRLIVITADHGESLGEHGYYFDHGRDCYTPSIHVPLLVQKRAEITPGIDVRSISLTGIISIALTVLDPFSAVSNADIKTITDREWDTSCSCQQTPIFLQATTNMLQHGRDSSTLELRTLMRGVKCGDILFFDEVGGASKLIDRSRDSSETVDVSDEHREMAIYLEGILADRLTAFGLDDEENTLDLRHDQQKALRALGYIE